MKKNMIITTLLLTFSITSFAQTEKGEFIIGGNFDFNTKKHVGFTVTEFIFSPTVGYFVANNLAVGIGLDYSVTKFSAFKGESIAIMPFARYYFGKHDKLRFFGHAGIGLASGNLESTDFSNRVSSYKSKKFTYKAGLGASYFFTKNAALEGMLQYSNTKYDNTLGFNLGLKIHF